MGVCPWSLKKFFDINPLSHNFKCLPLFDFVFISSSFLFFHKVAATKLVQMAEAKHLRLLDDRTE